MSEIIKVHAVYIGATDRSVGKPKWFFENDKDALFYSRGRGYYGADAHVRLHHVAKIDGKCYLLVSTDEIKLNEAPDELSQIKLNALNKLTQEEKEALVL